MEKTAATQEIGEIHNNQEIANIFHCGKIMRDWVDDPDMPSNYAITLLHATLFDSVEGYTKKGLVPNKPGDYRIEDIWVGNEPKNFYVRGLDVRFLMRSYGESLDEVLQSLPVAPKGHTEMIIHQAAWAYYTFIRIHPFLDGNGRVSRMVLQRVLKGGGFKDIVFSQETNRSNKKQADNKDRHLTAMTQVDKTGSLSALEAYLAKELSLRYISPAESGTKKDLEELYIKKKLELRDLKERKPLSDIWDKFADIDIVGNEIRPLEDQ